MTSSGLESIKFVDTIFENNKGPTAAGIFTKTQNLDLIRVSCAKNKATSSHSIFVIENRNDVSVEDTQTITIDSCSFTSNESTAGPGVIYI